MTDVENKSGSARDRAYQSLLGRLKDSITAAEEKTVSALKYDLDQAIELETAAEEMTREEASLLAAYLKRDLKSLARFLSESRNDLGDWLKFDTGLLEGRLLELLLVVADKTKLEQEEFSRELAERDLEYRSGDEVLVGTFACDGCGNTSVFTGPATLDDCAGCDGKVFHRVTE